MLLCAALPAQDLIHELGALYNQQQYDAVIKYKLGKKDNVPAKAWYYVAMAYYMKEDDKNAMKYMDVALETGPVDYDMFYYKGMILFYQKAYRESLPFFDKAIALLPNEPDFCASKAEAHRYLGDTLLAEEYFQRATRLPDCKPRVWILLAEVYQDLDKKEHAFNAYKTALTQLAVTDENYQTCLFNMGLLAQLSGKPVEAKDAFEKHVATYPKDFHAVSKLIQTYYALGEYDKAEPYKKIMHQAHKEKKLQKELENGFCFDQFKFNDSLVMVYENFDKEGDDFLSRKIDFIITFRGEILYTISLETDALMSEDKKHAKFVLATYRGTMIRTHWQHVFIEPYKYPEVKLAVLELLKEG
jgi:tetratricopeptide (TPR) repeat protein